MTQAKKLIEVALPVKEISTESVRDKYIRHGHISTLHLWWARRPLPVSRAIVFASLVPDPLDENCPQAFRDAVDTILGKENNPGDPYEPYDDIPYTAAIDPLEDNLRNRLLMFIGRFSEKFIENGKKGKSTPTRDKVSDHSLITWDNKNNEEILQKARKLIWVAQNAEKETGTAEYHLTQFKDHWQAVKDAEKNLYEHPDRHKSTPEVQEKETQLEQAIESFLNRMPKVFDPFAGGGAIPLEASRLGCRSYGNDLNPVAHIIQKGSLEFPQKFGKSITFSKEAFIEKYGEEKFQKLSEKGNLFKEEDKTKIKIDNRLSYDVEYYANKLLKETQEEIGYLYPDDDKNREIIAYQWARTVPCSNPSCKFEVPLVGTQYLCRKKNKKVAFKLIPDEEKKKFTIAIEKGQKIGFDTSGTVSRGKATCPNCKAVLDADYLKGVSKKNGLGKKLIAVILDGDNGKEYRLPTGEEIEAANIDSSQIERKYVPHEKMQKISDLVSGRGWGIDKWSQLFTDRQLYFLQKLIEKIDSFKETELNPEVPYNEAVITYLAIWIDRLAAVNTAMGRWNVGGEKIETPFSRQALPFIFDHPESNPFCNSTGSALNHLDWIIRYIESESNSFIPSICKNAASGDKSQFESKEISATVTDPPYYDAIAYADLSDFFYVWLKKSLGDIYPLNFATPQTPKSDECTALKHHHDNDANKAKKHFENKLKEIFSVIEEQTEGVVSVMFAHQSTEAWSTLCNSVLGSNMNITGSWAIDTEMGSRMISLGNMALESSVTVSCRPIEKKGFGDFQEIRNRIEQTIKKEVDELYEMGFRGADLLTACFGQAVREFGKYERVEKADGSLVEVEELLTTARESAFNAIISDIEADDVTRFYIGWLNLFGFTEAEHDDVRRITQIGLNLDVSELGRQAILIQNGESQSLAQSSERLKEHKNLGMTDNAKLIDKAHRAMILYRNPNRNQLLDYLGTHAPSEHDPFWRVVNALAEVLPPDTKDYDAVTGLITNKENLLKEAQQTSQKEGQQQDIFNEE